jgi:protein-S-isoprenylcysteine O-methyltransferase Ste14
MLLVYLGWITLIFSFIILFQSRRNQKVAEQIENKIADSNILIEGGIYSVIRYPEYLGFKFLIIGLILISQHWISIFSGVIGITLFYLDIKNTDRKNNSETNSQGYREYINEVPMLNMIEGIQRFQQRKSK